MNSGRPRREPFTVARLLPLILVAAACLFNLATYRAELTVAAPRVNDDVFHLALIERMDQAWDEGGNPLDTWVGYWGQGFPVLRYYQHLPHLSVVVAHRILCGAVPLDALFDGLRLLLLALLPLSLYIGSRRLGASALAAGFVALCAPLLGADPAQRHFLGFQPATFLWSGGGLFSQLAAMVLLPLALGSISQATLGGRRYVPAVAWLAATWLSHLVLGYVTCLLGAVVMLRPEARGQRGRVLRRLAAIYAGVALVTAYLLLPTLLESRWLARSLWEPAEYWDSYGAAKVMTALVTGALLDGDRLPVLTVLAGLGAMWTVWSSLRGRHRKQDGFALAALGMFVIALLLYFGRPTWGALLDLLPFSGSLPLHRLIFAVQLAGLLLAGLGLSRLVGLIARPRTSARAVLAGLGALALLAPAIASTLEFAERNARWRQEAATAWAANGARVDDALERFRSLDQESPGRGYAGSSWDWGREFRIGTINVYHRWSVHDLPAIGYMYHTMGLASELEPFFDPWRRDHHELFNVRWRLADDPRRLPPFARPLSTETGLVAATVDTAGLFGVVGIVGYFDWRDADKRALFDFNRAVIASDWHAGGQFVRIGWREGDTAAGSEISLGVGTELPSGGIRGHVAPRGTVLSVTGHGDRYSARVRLEDPGYILFRMSYHPNWQAVLDGKPVETIMLAPGYLGVRAAKGEHVLEMHYRSPMWTRVLPWAALAFLGLLAWGHAAVSPSRIARVPNVA